MTVIFFGLMYLYRQLISVEMLLSVRFQYMHLGLLLVEEKRVRDTVEAIQ